MSTALIDRRPGLVVRRNTLVPGEATPWHVDPHRRLTVVIRGERLRIDFASGTTEEVHVSAGETGWDEPTFERHRAVNLGSGIYEEVVVFLVPIGDEARDPQPAA